MEQLHANLVNDFRSFLEQELARRSHGNPNYSLRAFARDLDVDSSFLSKLLNGKRSMTARTILALAPKLALTPEQVDTFVQNSNGRRRRYAMKTTEVSANILAGQAAVELNISEGRLPEVMEKIENFHRELALATSSSAGDERIFKVSVSVFKTL